MPVRLTLREAARRAGANEARWENLVRDFRSLGIEPVGVTSHDLAGMLDSFLRWADLRQMWRGAARVKRASSCSLRSLRCSAPRLYSRTTPAATLPFYPSGSSSAKECRSRRTRRSPRQVHLFGDTITARLAVVADTKWVDPARLRVTTDFKPYASSTADEDAGCTSDASQQLTWTWTLRCLTTACVPRVPPSERFHIFRFQLIHIDYLTTTGTRGVRHRRDLAEGRGRLAGQPRRRDVPR